MSGPPENIPPSELFAVLCARPRPHRLVDVELSDSAGKPLGQIIMCPLTPEELLLAKAEATRKGKELTKDNLDPKEYVVGHHQIYEELCSSEILFRACRRKENINLFVFPSAADVRKRLLGDEMAVLIQSYAIVQVEIGPIISNMSEAEMDAWLDRLAEGGSALPLGLLSLEMLRTLALHGAKRLRALTTGNGSSGTPVDDNTSSEPKPPNETA